MTIAGRPDHPGELRIFQDAEQLAATATELFVELSADAIRTRGRFRIALSGGSTPRRVYELLATTAFNSRVQWNQVDIFWGDERYVPADDRDSNYRMAGEALLRLVPIPAANIHRVPTEISEPAGAATAYENTIRRCFGEDQSVPQFDLIYLGLGANGHTASLFPYSPALSEVSQLVLADFVIELKSWRITMSVPLLNCGRTVAFLISGAEKAQVLREVLLGPREPARLPAQLIAPEGSLLWLADEAAAALVSRERLKRSA